MDLSEMASEFEGREKIFKVKIESLKKRNACTLETEDKLRVSKISRAT